ncbi:hypothetical protein ERO13_D09G098750v2 [Gossypium hirsutum]|nr:hypothetical protein ERO13_D09G098750v2 [Gossypium hirsutum]
MVNSPMRKLSNIIIQLSMKLSLSINSRSSLKKLSRIKLIVQFSLHTHAKLYSYKMDRLKMSTKNPHQHVAYFIETCNDIKIDSDLMVKQLVWSLKGNAFNWYTYLDPRTIDSSEQLECEFFNKFYITHRIVSITELTGARQWKDELATNYIHHWRNLGIKSKTFKELATRADDMELIMTIARNLEPFI